MNDLFNLYWFDTRTGLGHPCLDHPETMSYDEAARFSQGRPRHPKDQRLERHHEPAELHQKYTVKNPAK